jgi:Uma2 family endonuclease
MAQLQSLTEVIYPDQDGNPMSDNTKQFRWIVVIQQNLESLFADDPQVFVAGDLLWYPIEGDNKTCTAPDAMVVFGRPKGDRGSYQQWKEDNIPPQVVFEILSPGNTLTGMSKKQEFYDRYGVEEYYLYDPDKNDLSGWLRTNDRLSVIDEMQNWVSPRLGIRFEVADEDLQLYLPNEEPFKTHTQLLQQRDQALQRAEQFEQQADQERQRADQERQRAERLAERLRSLGVDPNQM